MTRVFRGATGLFFCAASLLYAQDGQGWYKQACASCHEGGLDRAPSREAFQQMSPAGVLAAMETGPMISMAVRFSQAQRRAIAEYLTGKSFNDPIEVAASPKAMCANSPGNFSLPATRAHLERLGHEYLEHTFSGSGRRRFYRRASAAPEAEVGLRISR